MGSDLAGYAPTPDERRIVRGPKKTAIYKRHTDGIYGDTRTWTRAYLKADATGTIYQTLRETMPGVRWSTVDRNFTFAEKVEFEALGTPDRNWDAEQAQLENQVEHARRQSARAYAEAEAREVELERFLIKRKEAGK